MDEVLLRRAALVSALILGNYLLWALRAPAGLAEALVAAALVAMLAFLVRRPLGEYLPLKLMVVAALLLTLGTPTVGWDTRSIWMLHAKRLYYDWSLYAQFDNYASWSSNDYPDLVPALAATLARLLGHWSEPSLKLSSALALFPGLLILAAGLRSPLHRLALVCFLLVLGDEWLFNGYMDALLAVYFCCAGLLLLRQSQAGAPIHALVSGLVVASLTLLKNEGLAMAVTLSLSALGLLVVGHGRRLPWRVVAAMGVGLVPILAWKTGCALWDVRSELASSGFLLRLAGRAVSGAAWWQIASALVWQWPFVPTAVAASLAAWRYGRRVDFQFLALAALSYLGFLVLVYLSTPRDLAWHLGSSVDRTILPVAMMLGYALLLADSESRSGAQGAQA